MVPAKVHCRGFALLPAVSFRLPGRPVWAAPTSLVQVVDADSVGRSAAEPVAETITLPMESLYCTVCVDRLLDTFGGLSATVTLKLPLPAPPKLSVTLTVTVYVRSSGKLCN